MLRSYPFTSERMFIGLATALCLLIGAANSSFAQEHRYILFTHPPLPSKAHYQAMINDLEESERFLFVRPNLNMRHIYAELRPGANFNFEVLSQLLDDYGIQPGCFTKGVIAREPIQYFDLKDCEWAETEGPE